MKRTLKCQGCGKSTHSYEAVKLKKCEITLCNSCLDEIHWAQSDNLPMIWAGSEDLTLYVNAFHDKNGDPLDEKDMPKVSLGDMKRIIRKMTDWFWDCHADKFSDDMRDAYDALVIDKEHDMIAETPYNKLPLLIGQIKHKDNIEYLDQRLKEKKNG